MVPAAWWQMTDRVFQFFFNFSSTFLRLFFKFAVFAIFIFSVFLNLKSECVTLETNTCCMCTCVRCYVQLLIHTYDVHASQLHPRIKIARKLCTSCHPCFVFLRICVGLGLPFSRHREEERAERGVYRRGGTKGQDGPL